MSTTNSEQRTSARLYFSPDELVEATFSRSGNLSRTNTATVLNISEGGLCFTFNKSNIFYKGDRFTLLKLEDKLGPLFKGRVEMEVRWTIQHQDLSEQSVGCVFLAGPKNLQSCLASLISQKMTSGHNLLNS